MKSERASLLERVGIFLAAVEACLLGFVAALHFGFEWRVAGTTYAAPYLYPAAIIEAVLALVLFISVVAPGTGRARAGRVLAAQVLVFVGIVAGELGIMRGAALTTAGTQIFYAVILVLAAASAVLVSSPLIASIQRRADRSGRAGHA